MLTELLEIPDLHGMFNDSYQPMYEPWEILDRCAERVAVVIKWNAKRDQRFPGWRDRARVERGITL